MANGFSHLMDVELLKKLDANCESGLIADISLTFFWHFDQTFLKRGYEKPAQFQIFAFITSNAVNNNGVLQGEQTNTQPGNNAWPSLSQTSVLFTVWSVCMNSAWPLPPDFNIHVSLFNSCMDTEMSAVWYNVHLWCSTSLFLLSAVFFFLFFCTLMNRILVIVCGMWHTFWHEYQLILGSQFVRLQTLHQSTVVIYILKDATRTIL